MTLLMFNGFEGGYDTPEEQKNLGDGIVNLETPTDWEYTTGRNGGKAITNKSTVWNKAAYMKFPPITNDKIAIVGFAFYVTAGFGSNSDRLAQLYGTSMDGVHVLLDVSGNLIARAVGFGTQEETSMPVNINQWYYIEMKGRIDDTNGYAHVRVNEQVLLDYTGYLHYSGSTTISNLYLRGYSYNRGRIDDVYVADNQGSDVNDYLGDIRIDAVRPNGAGNYAQLTPSAGANYECVDEVLYDDSDYVEGVDSADKDSYTYGSVPTDLDDAGIIALQIKNNAKRTATADNIKIDPFIRTGSTDYSQTVQNLSDDFAMVDGDIILNDPDDSNPWTQAKINACEFGMEVG